MAKEHLFLIARLILVVQHVKQLELKIENALLKNKSSDLTPWKQYYAHNVLIPINLQE